MSKSLKIDNGDLAVGGGRKYDTVEGPWKLAQDLRLWILERIGTDPSTPTFGSRLDGGIIGGEELQSFIGQVVTQQRISEIQSEVASVVTQYQQSQLERIKLDAIELQGQQTLTPDEILHLVESIDAKSVGDIVAVRVICRTMSNKQFKLVIPVQV